MKRDDVYLNYMLECIHRIEEDTEGGYDMFYTKHLIQDAVLRNLHTLTETSQRLSDDLKQKHDDIEWDRIAAFRNVLVHDYLGVDLKRIWSILQSDLPRLKKRLEEIAKGME